jgi:hypothetical protein
LRCLREIVADVWVIVDVSNDYFDHEPSNSTSEVKCRRRPSGVIIRKHGNGSEVSEKAPIFCLKKKEKENSDMEYRKLYLRCDRRVLLIILIMFSTLKYLSIQFWLSTGAGYMD